ncbi:MAG: 4a-hydroxytetrahydrobiopterin dehydratase [Planctomycetota bacterium]
MESIPEKCVPCEGGVEPLSRDAVRAKLELLDGWRLNDSEPPSIERRFELPDFRKALAWVNRVGMLAEEEGHHPDLHIESWNRVRIVLYTHAIGGLHDNDFVVAQKIDRLFQKR